MPRDRKEPLGGTKYLDDLRSRNRIEGLAPGTPIGHQTAVTQTLQMPGDVPL